MMMIDEFANVPAVQFEHAVPVRPFVDVPSGHAVQSGLDALSAFASVAQPPPRDVRPAEQLAQTGPRSPQPKPLQPYWPAVQKRGHAEAAAVAETDIVGADVCDGAAELELDAVAVDVPEEVALAVAVLVGVTVTSASATPATAAASSSARSAPAARGAVWRGMGPGGRARATATGRRRQ
jgi:hypothetical protein